MTNHLFHRASRSVCTPERFIGAVIGLGMATCLWMLSPNAISISFRSKPFREFEQRQPAKPTVIYTPMTLAGYQEDFWGPAKDAWVRKLQNKYRKEASELDAAIANCKTPSSTAFCDPKIKAFGTMLDAVAKIPDELVQTKIITAYINLIRYDYKEAKTSATNLDHKSLLRVLTDDKGICDQSAGLKVYGRERIGSSLNATRWVALYAYKNHKLKNEGHAITAARIGGTIWALDNQDYSSLYRKRVTANQLQKIIEWISTIEPIDANFNATNQSKFSKKGEYFVPHKAYSSGYVTEYVTKKPATDSVSQPMTEIAKKAKPETTHLTHEEMLQYNVLEILRPMLAVRYKLPKLPHGL